MRSPKFCHWKVLQMRESALVQSLHASGSEKGGLRCAGHPLWAQELFQRTGPATPLLLGRIYAGKSMQSWLLGLLASPLLGQTSAVGSLPHPKHSCVVDGRCPHPLNLHRAVLRLAPCWFTAGYMNLATAELCARWIAVGAWQPFVRVHHAQSFQELYRCANYDKASALCLYGSDTAL